MPVAPLGPTGNYSGLKDVRLVSPDPESQNTTLEEPPFAPIPEPDARTIVLPVGPIGPIGPPVGIEMVLV